jgi:hypothetical protein
MKIRKIYESMSDPDDMFEIFKDIVDDVLLIEFDKELSYDFKKGQIEVTYDGEIYLDPGDDDIHEICQEDNWGFQFSMPDRREDKRRIQERIVNLFESQSGTKIGFYELPSSDYNHHRPEIKVLFSKPEWITWSVNLRDFEEVAPGEIEYQLPSRFQSINVISDFYYMKMSNRSFSLIFEPQDSMGLKVDFKRSNLLDELEIRDGEMEYDLSYYPCCYYGGTWMQLTEKMDKVEVLDNEKNYLNAYVKSLKAGTPSKWRNYVNIDDVKKHQLIKAANELNSAVKVFKVDLYEDQDENVNKFVKFLSEMVLSKIQNDDSKLIEQVEEQISKLEREDNIVIDNEVVNSYVKDDNSFVVWLCETEFKDEHYIFKFTLNLNKGQIMIHGNSDDNKDGKTILTCPISELSDSLFLALIDNKLQSTK